ncbi:hypothetical protein evm_014506 [Chilo suppressalis]|nr:hypothetical protein evm_014506 [Chilo suppressalis]
MESRVRANPEQLSTLLEFMKSHGDLARPLTGAQGRVRSDRLWADLTNILNAVGGGVTKTTDKWKKVWADWKSKTKKKGLIIRSHARGTGGGPASQQILSALDEMLAIMGPLAVEGQASVQELGFNKSQSAAPTQQLSPPTIQDNPIYLEIVNETPDLPTSPQPSTSSQSEAPSRPPRRRRPPTPGASATLPTAGRRPRMRSPATPQSTASPGRPRLRARRRLAPTPFERAASEFAAIELRRLELEDTRTRLQHER